MTINEKLRLALMLLIEVQEELKEKEAKFNKNFGKGEKYQDLIQGLDTNECPTNYP